MTQPTGQEILRSLPIGVMVTDPEGVIVTVNGALAGLLGYDSESLVGQHLNEITAEASLKTEAAALETLNAGKRPEPYIKELVTASGELLPVEVQAGTVVDDDGSHKGTIFAIKNLSQEMQLLKDLQRRNLHLLASSEVSKAATQILDIQELLTRCVDLIRIHFGFYYAAIFLIDDQGEWAPLRAATGEAGHQLLATNHKLAVGSQSMVGWVTANNAARIALDVGEEAIRFDNPYLPKTRSEMALPLRVRGQVIGALDVQSTSLNAFSEEDIQTIQMMADQVAIAIDNARLFSKQPGA